MDAEVGLMIIAGGGLIGVAVIVYLLGELERMKFNQYCLTLEVKNLVAIVKDVQAKQREKDGGENGKGRNETVGVLPGDPTYNAVLGKWRREQRLAREQKRAMMPIRVLGVVRLLIKEAGYKLISDIEIMDVKTGNRYRSVTRGEGGFTMTNGIAFGLGVGVGSFVTMVAFVAALWIALFWRRNR